MANENGSVNGKSADKNVESDRLIENFKNGVPGAFDEIAEKYKGLVAKRARSFDGGNGYFDDLYQEGLLALYRASCGYKSGQASFSAYADRAIRNSMVSWVRESRGGRRSDISIDELDGAGLQDAFSDTPEEAYLSKLFCSELKKRAMKLLSDYERCVFLLYLEDMTPAETAECLGKPRKSVENALNRIKAKLTHN